MKTTEQPKTAAQIAQETDIVTLTEQVRATQIYAHGYFTLLTKLAKRGKKWELVDRLIMSEPSTRETAEEWRWKFEHQLQYYGERHPVKAQISIHNIFERYDLWKEGQGHDIPRAQQWADIKAAAQSQAA